jgi:hypothetical protein
MSHRRELAGAGLLFVLGLGSVAGLQAVMGRQALPLDGPQLAPGLDAR